MNADPEPPDSRSFAEAFARLIDRIAAVAREDMELRRLLGKLGQGLIRLAGTEQEFPAAPQPPLAGTDSPSQEQPSQGAGATIEETQQMPTPGVEQLLPLIDIGSQAEPQPQSLDEFVSLRSSVVLKPEDHLLIERRCRLKAEACRWALTRLRLLAGAADFRTEIQPQDDEIIGRGRQIPDCYLWMCSSRAPLVEDQSIYEDIAGCFDTCADAASLLHAVGGEDSRNRGLLEKAVDLAAEAQSMLRVIVERLGAKPDSDQYKMFLWLKTVALQEQILITRYMRLDDPADPAKRDELQSQLEILHGEVSELKGRDRRQRALFNRICYHRKRIAAHPVDDHTHDWKTIYAAIDDLVSGGLPPSNVELRDLLSPLIDELPEAACGPNVELVLREIDRYLATRQTGPGITAEAQPTSEVREAAELLRGRSILMVGGEERPYAKQALERAFGLKELIWMKTREGNTRLDFDPLVANPDVAAVLLAIRWSRHCYEEVKVHCDKHSKPLVRLPRGYNPNQVAHEIAAQASEHLRSLPDA